MVEKVNPSHPDKVADRIAGAIVDYAYTLEENPRVAVEVLIGHGECTIVAETSCTFDEKVINKIVRRIGGNVKVNLLVEEQDEKLAKNQLEEIKCGDNGIFKGVPLSVEETKINCIAREIYNITQTDGKYILDNNKLVICQSNINTTTAEYIYSKTFNNWGMEKVIINPLGDWTGGIEVDTGATNRKLGSDMGSSVTGGGLHGKDLSKADVSINIYAFLEAQRTGRIIELSCAIGDTLIDGKPYSEIVEIARNYVNKVGGFENFAKWGLL